MKVIGLCGQSGAGKGLVCAFFSDFNIKCIDTDRVYHDIISSDSECTKELVAFFGDSIYANPGINRKNLAKAAFTSSEHLKKLNEITHKHILNSVRSQIKTIKSENRYDGIIIDAPLLFESGFDAECDATIAVISDSEIKISRIMARDGITRDMALKRISSQISDSSLGDKCTYVIHNNSSSEELKTRVCELKKIIFNQEI